MFEAAHRALRELEPALLVVDDLQWLDELSLALCRYLIRAAYDSEQRIAVFAASRLDESGSALGESLPRERVVRMDLGPLGRDEGVELALALDSGLDSAAAAELWEGAQGSPFWLEALTRTGGSAACSASEWSAAEQRQRTLVRESCRKPRRCQRSRSLER